MRTNIIHLAWHFECRIRKEIYDLVQCTIKVYGALPIAAHGGHATGLLQVYSLLVE